MSRPQTRFAQRLAHIGFRGPFRLDHVSRGLVIDRDGHPLGLALPVFRDPADRDWFAEEMMRALNVRAGFPETEIEAPLDPKHLAAAKATDRPYPKAAE
jgi:hypothetical protein